VTDRWRGSRARRAIAAAVVAGIAIVLPGSGPRPSALEAPAGAWQLVVRDAGGRVVLLAPLPDGDFALRYRNSLYGTTAEERFAVADDGELRLVELAADQAAVLDEYYAVGRPPRPSGAGDPRQWRAPPAAELSLAQLSLAATQHGRRTLVVEGLAVPLWPLATPTDPSLTLVAEPRG
jgi:hypothetical protein